MRRTLQDLNLNGARCILRVDLNVPLAPEGNAILNDTRLVRAAATIRELCDLNAVVIVTSHLGRPKGKPDPNYSLAIVERRLAELVERPVRHVQDIVGEDARYAVQNAGGGDVVMLENLRFDSREEANDAQFAEALAALGDVYVNDAFGVSHRKHASVVGVPAHLPSAFGPQLLTELEMLSSATEFEARPAAVVLSGAKADKLNILANLVPNLDSAVLGGGMAAAFLRLQGYQFRGFEISDAELQVAEAVAERYANRILLPGDYVVVKEFTEEAPARIADVEAVEPDEIVMDIGPRTIEAYEKAIARSKTVIWNGPMGFYEWEKYQTGTVAVARAIALTDGPCKIAGGGSTVSVIDDLGLESSFSHVSNGGGASLKVLEGVDLPGVLAIENSGR